MINNEMLISILYQILKTQARTHVTRYIPSWSVKMYTYLHVELHNLSNLRESRVCGRVFGVPVRFKPAQWLGFQGGPSDEIEDFLNQPIMTKSDLTFVEEVTEWFSTLWPRKASESGDVSKADLLWLPKRGVLFLFGLFNACFGHSYFSLKWHWDKVILISKPGNEKLRPISFLSYTANFFERLILRRIQEHA